jgi:hypothetical protein
MQKICRSAVADGSFATEPPNPGCHPMSAILLVATNIAWRCNMSRRTICRLVHRNKYRAAIVQLAGGNQAALS